MSDYSVLVTMSKGKDIVLTGLTKSQAETVSDQLSIRNSIVIIPVNGAARQIDTRDVTGVAMHPAF